ncbi:MAG: hypothetical protein CVU03_13540 [Bacteroidetes bacterium HGW-Bacteroidetes-2]|jgi:hypothetical protein|nr:MAG: hypothetical protein CVU03_13540 [Bacteroidetes bacterium HGW-Bacteroidetes-2]
MLKNILNLNGVQKLSKKEQVLLRGGGPISDPFDDKCKGACGSCNKNSDCCSGACATGHPNCPSGSKCL